MHLCVGDSEAMNMFDRTTNLVQILMGVPHVVGLAYTQQRI